MVLKEWLKQVRQYVAPLDAELILMTYIDSAISAKVDRSYIITHSDLEISGEWLGVLMKMVQRRVAGEPLAYILGHKEFYGRDFIVSRDVLIPRVETETLIDLVKTLDLPNGSRIIEVGTGSGCIAITLALELIARDLRVVAVDISERALNLARRNASAFQQAGDLVEFKKSDLLDGIANGEKFDAVVANLPYVNRGWKWVDQNNLKYEPDLALYVDGENGLALYRKLLHQIEQKIKVEFLVFEADLCQHEDLIKMAEEHCWRLVKTDGYGLLFKKQG